MINPVVFKQAINRYVELDQKAKKNRLDNKPESEEMKKLQEEITNAMLALRKRCIMINDQAYVRLNKELKRGAFKQDTRLEFYGILIQGVKNGELTTPDSITKLEEKFLEPYSEHRIKVALGKESSRETGVDDLFAWIQSSPSHPPDNTNSSILRLDAIPTQ